MNKELKYRWVTALRSGDYEQGQGYLCRNNKYCCLGVLAEIEGDLETEEGTWFIGTKDNDSCDINISTLDNSYRTKYGLTYKTCIFLMGMNDSGKSFAEIADWIEENI